MIQVSFVLVEPQDERNVGSVARAMKTMGYEDLRLVRPHCDPLGEKARVLAHGSVEILQSAQIYRTLPEALSQVDFACATTARHRLTKYHYTSVRELPQRLQEKQAWISRVALVFGSERSGLSNQDIALCDLVTTIPQATLSPSLNLAQAVMVCAFVLSESHTAVQIKDQRINGQSMPMNQYAALRSSTLRLMHRIGLADRYQSWVIKGLGRLGYEDLYLLHRIRSFMERKLDELEGKAASFPPEDGKGHRGS
ncbi:TrmH family RNA methyltransferase [Lyngbya confervoides]|uniref:tRNA/rRNA methyltransferase SpoU type domain-containing protein n=1 Tax=Lyngbya confervoides BDU141951 TaxID=1574623 RepID=A0ABD4T2X6_9CYAN|nr:TrmH family RNA methyltransferase [Lyngbya confervoides]MCM1982800.1 hypothetical protein [Lyngbya confervoides BDU141951]